MDVKLQIPHLSPAMTHNTNIDPLCGLLPRTLKYGPQLRLPSCLASVNERPFQAVGKNLSTLTYFFNPEHLYKHELFFFLFSLDPYKRDRARDFLLKAPGLTQPSL